MNFSLQEKAKENIIVVAHRGASGGNIPCTHLQLTKSLSSKVQI